MISIQDARSRILAALTPTSAEIIPLAHAAGRVTATAITARLTHPPHDVSAMDGYALRHADGETLHIIGEAPAGHPWPGTIAPGQAIRLFTGSVIPSGADCVVIQENVTRTENHITLSGPRKPGQNIRPAGQDFTAGQTLLPASHRLTARDIGLIAAANHPWVSVHRRPRVAILATGDEIALPGDPIPDGGIVSSNAHALAALITQSGGDPSILPIAPDTHHAIAEAGRAAAGFDLLLTTGGASVGDHDLVASGLQQAGLTLDFWTIAMRPGKPLMHGHLGPLPLIGLPGNPVSALVCALLFALPALDRLQGLPGHPPTPRKATLASALQANDHRADHLRATLTPTDTLPLATPASRQDSGQLRTLAWADALILRPPHAPRAEIGDVVDVILLR
jgi:molybdopterin molybdotransferase